MIVFKCSQCDEVVVSKFLKEGDIFTHKECGGKTPVPSESIEYNPSDLDESILSQINEISNEQQSKVEEDTTTKEVTEEKHGLSEKYKFLNVFKVLIVLSIVGYTLIFFSSLDELEQVYKYTGNTSVVITSIVTYILLLFYSISLYSIVNFLFGLDKQKQDKV